MNTLDELLQAVESDRFSALVNLASSYKLFVRALSAQPEVGQLAQVMQATEAKKAVADRALTLVGVAAEAGREHPGDSALAAYLWLLNRADRGLAILAAERVAEVPGCWWARKVAEEVLSGGELDGSTGKDSVPGVRAAP
jgi:hypothetical protein